MNALQTTLAGVVIGLLITDIILTRRMMDSSKRMLDATRAVLRALGYADTEGDIWDTPIEQNRKGGAGQ